MASLRMSGRLSAFSFQSRSRKSMGVFLSHYIPTSLKVCIYEHFGAMTFDLLFNLHL